MSVMYIRDKNGNFVPVPAIKGYTPVKGVDYYTEADKVEIVQRVIEALGGNPVFGIVDEDNNIIVSGDLPSGTYSVKYEMEDGSVVDIGDLVLSGAEPEPAYTNILTSGDYEIQLNQRWSASSKAYSACDGMISIMIPVADVLNKTIYFSGFTKDLKASNQPPLWMALDANKARTSSIVGDGTGNLWNATALVDEGDGVYSVLINATSFETIASAAYVVLNMAVNESTAITTLPDTLIMTIDEPIV